MTRARDLLVESTDFLLAALERLNEAVVVVDGDLRVSYFNAAAEHVWQLDRAEVLGRCGRVQAKRTGRSTYRFFSADVVYIQITVFNTRTAEQKKAPFKRTAELLGKNPGIRPEDVFIIVLDAAKENWSVGNGLAQFA